MDLKEIMMNEKIKKAEEVEAKYDGFAKAMDKTKTREMRDTEGNVYRESVPYDMTTEEKRNVDAYTTATLVDSVYTEYIRERSGLEYDTVVFGLDFMLETFQPAEWVDSNNTYMTEVFGQLIPIDEGYNNLDATTKKEYLFDKYDSLIKSNGYTDTDIQQACSAIAKEMWPSEIKNTSGKNR